MRLIVNADDFGYTPGVTRGVVQAHREGIVTATTLMTNAPDSDRAGRIARSMPSFDVGVHVVFTYGRALTPPERIRSLVDEHGAFPRVRDLLRSGQPTAEHALVEARAQYERARELIGREPTHLDTHHWVHDMRALEDAMLELAKETGAVLRAHDGRQRSRFRDAGVRATDRFVREYQHAGAIGVDSLVALLEHLADQEAGTVELMCHPGDPDAALLGGSTYGAERGVELRTLTDPTVRATIDRLDIELVTFSAL